MPPKGKKSVFDNIQGIEDTLQGTPSDITNYGDKTDTTAQDNYDRLNQNALDLASAASKKFGANLLASLGGTLANTFDLVSAVKTAKGELTGSDDDYNSSLFGLTTQKMNDWAASVDRNNPIYEKNEGTTSPSDPAWWAKEFGTLGILAGTGIGTAASTMAIEAATEGGGTPLAMAKLAKNIKAAWGAVKGGEVVEGALNLARGMKGSAALYATIGRYTESRLEAQNNYKETLDALDKEKKPDGSDYTDEEKQHLASEGARRDFNLTMAQLPLDILAFRAMVFNPVAGTAESGLERGLEHVASKFGTSALGKSAGWLTTHALGATVEGLEGSTIPVFQEEGHHYAQVLAGHDDGKSLPTRLGDTIGSSEFWDNFATGTLGGILISPTMTAVQNYSTNRKNRDFNEYYANYLKNIPAVDSDIAAKIQEQDKAGNTDNATQLRKQFNANKQLSSIHLDALANKTDSPTSSFEVYNNFLKSTLNDVNNGNYDNIKDLFGEVKPEQVDQVKKEFQDYINDGTKMKTIYDGLKNSYDRNSLPVVTNQNFQLQKLHELTPELDANITKEKSAIPNYTDYSNYGKQLFDHRNNLKVVNEDLRRLRGELSITEDTFAKKNLQEVIDSNEKRADNIKKSIQEINNNEGYEESDRDNDRDINNSSIVNNNYLQSLYDKEYVNNEISRKRKEIGLWNNKQFTDREIQNNIDNAQTNIQLNAAEDQIQRDKTKRNARNSSNNIDTSDSTHTNTNIQSKLDTKEKIETARKAELNNLEALIKQGRTAPVNSLQEKLYRNPKTHEKVINDKYDKLLSELPDTELQRSIEKKRNQLAAQQIAPTVEQPSQHKDDNLFEEDNKHFDDILDSSRDIPTVQEGNKKPLSSTKNKDEFDLNSDKWQSITVPSVEDKKSIHNDHLDDLDKRAKELGVGANNIKQLNAQYGTDVANGNKVPDGVKELLIEYGEQSTKVKALTDENEIAKLNEENFGKWAKANDVQRTDLGKVVNEDDLDKAAQRVRILNKRGETKKADAEFKNLKESFKNEKWTIGSYKERFDDDLSQKEIDDLNAENKSFNEKLKKAIDDAQAKETKLPIPSVPSVEDKKTNPNKIKDIAEGLVKSLPEYLPNVENENGQKVLDFAADLYDKPRIDIHNSKYLDWFKDLSHDAYNAVMKFNHPREAIKELMKSAQYEGKIKETKLPIPKQPENVPSVEARKADIEKRRNDELDYYKNGFGRHEVEKNTENYITNENGEYLITDTSNRGGTFTKNRKEGEITEHATGHLLKVIESWKKGGTRYKDLKLEVVKSHAQALEEKNNEINSKYDAELKALENESQPTVQEDSNVSIKNKKGNTKSIEKFLKDEDNIGVNFGGNITKDGRLTGDNTIELRDSNGVSIKDTNTSLTKEEKLKLSEIEVEHANKEISGVEYRDKKNSLFKEVYKRYLQESIELNNEPTVEYYGENPEWSFAPVEYDFSKSPEATKLKITNAVNKLLSTLGNNPSFEDLIRHTVKIRGLDETDKMWNPLIYGWESNGKQKVDYDAVYNNVFGNPFDELTEAVSQLIPASQVATETVETLETNIVKEDKPVTFDNTNQPVYNYGNTRVTNESQPKMAFSSMASSLIADETESGIDVSHKQLSDKLTEGTDIDSRPLLDIHQFNPGTDLSIEIPSNFNDIKIPIYNNGMLIDTKTFGQYVAENGLSEDSQEYRDKIPMIISKKGDTKGVAFVHDIEWYHPLRFNQGNPEDMQSAIDSTRNIREEVLSNKGKANATITSKRQTTFSSLKTKQNTDGTYQLITLKEANPQTQLGIGTSNGTIMHTKGGVYPNNGGSLINDKPLLANRIYEVRPFGMKDGKTTYMAFPVIREKLDEQTKENIRQVIKAYMTKAAPNSISIKNEISKVMGIDIFSPMGLEKYLGHFIYTSNPRNLPRKEGTPYIATEKGTIIIGQVGVKQSTTKQNYVLDPKNVSTLSDLAGLDKGIIVDGKVFKGLLDWFEHNLNLDALSSNKNVVHIDKDGKTSIGDSYNNYLLSKFKTNIRSFNIGTEDKPNYVTNVQPVITYDTNKRLNKVVEQSTPDIKNNFTRGDLFGKIFDNKGDIEFNINRNKEFYKDDKDIGKNKNDILEDQTQWETKIKPFEYKGNKYEIGYLTDSNEGVYVHTVNGINFKDGDSKLTEEDILNEFNNGFTDYEEEKPLLLDKFKDVQDKMALKLALLNKAKKDLGTGFGKGKLNFSPTEDNTNPEYSLTALTDAQTQSIADSVVKIGGLTFSEQFDVVDYMYNQIVPMVDTNGGEIDKKSADKQVSKLYKRDIQPIKDEYTNSLKELQDFIKENPELEDDDIKNAIQEYKFNLGKIKAVENNISALKQLAFEKVLKNTNIKLDKSTESDNIIDSDTDAKDEEASQEDEQNKRDFNSDVLRENPDKKVTYAVRRLLGQIGKYDKEGNLVNGFLNLPTYTGSDTILRTLRTTLVDVPADFNLMMDRLEQRKNGVMWMQAVIDKLKNANIQTKNQFVTALAMTSLKMKFAMIANDRRTGNYNNKLYDTNLNGISDAIRNQWNNNLMGISPLVKMDNNQLVLDNEQANKLISEFKGWKGEDLEKVQNSLNDYWKDVVSKVGKNNYQTLTPTGNLATELKEKLTRNSDRLTFSSKGFDYQISKIGDGKYKVEFLNKNNASKEDVQKWLTNFGINLDNKTINELYSNGLKHNKSNVKWNGLFDSGMNTNGLLGILYNKLVNMVDKGGSVFDEEGNGLLSDSVIKSLANLESNYNETITPFGFRDNGKSFYAITTPKFITDRVVDLKRGGDILRQLASTSFTQPSLWALLLKDENFRDTFSLANVGDTAIKQRGKNVYKDSSITKLSSLDHEVVKLTAFQDTTQGKIKYESNGNMLDTYPDTSIGLRVGTMFSPTMSDKDQMTMITTAVLDLKNRDLNNSNGISDEVTKALYEQLVKPELQRIIQFRKNGSKTNISGYDDGAGMFFLLPSMNSIEYKNTGKRLIDLIEHEPNSFNLQALEGDNDLMKSFFSKIREYVDSEVKSKLEDWNNIGILGKDRDGATTIKFIDNKYFNDSSKFYGTLDEKVKMMAMDYTINNLIANANSFMTMIGDPALYFKSKSKDAIEIAKDTFDNIGKRLANQIAPGSKLANSENEKYIQLFIKDREVASNSLSYLEEILGKEEAASYKKVDASDAQEYTTWKEHLSILTRLGQTGDTINDITPEEIQEARELVVSGVDKNSLSEKQLAVIKKVAQPIKPVSTGQIYDKINDTMRVVYIKSSSFPLIPQLTKGFEIDKLRVAMEKLEDNKKLNVRASYQTANKVGSVNVSNDDILWNENSSINDNVLSNLEKNSLILDRKNFRIQQEVPFKSGKNTEDTVTLGTQLMKLLFGDNIIDYDGYRYKGEPFSGARLHSLYNTTFNKLVQEKQHQLFNELGLDSDGTPIDRAKTTQKLQKLLEDEAKKRGYPLQDIMGLKMDENGRFNLPIWSSISSDRYEAMLNAIVGNRMLRMKFPGNSYIVGSERGFTTQVKEEGDLTPVEKSKVIFTSSWNGKGLQYTRKEDGTLKQAQVFVASKFRDNSGKLVDLFTKKNGEYTYINDTPTSYQLKTDMIDKELLQLISFRIPTSGHQSSAVIEIAGFLPYTNGDLMIVPKEFTKQKGLDFDVDKENTYQLWHRMEEDGKFKVLEESHRNKILSEADTELQKRNTSEKADDKLLKALFGDELNYDDEDIEGDKKLSKANSRINEKLLHNDIIRMTKAVLTNPNNQIQAKIHKTLNTDYAEKEAKFIDNLIPKGDNKTWTGLSDMYQKGKLISGANGKLGTGAYSLDVVFHSLAQQARKTGNPINLTMIVEDEDGKPTKQTIQWKFGNKLYKAELGNSETGDGSRSVSDVLAERQNIAVDNEKLQVMGKVGLNDLTLDVDKVLNLIGVDKGGDGHSISFLLLSQPIIREYVENMKNANSNLAEYDKNKELNIVNKLVNKYDPIERDITDEYEDEMGEKMNNKNLILGISEQGKDGELQAAILRRFLELKKYGEQIRKVQSTLNFSQNSLGKSFFDVIAKRNKLASLGDGSEFVSNADKLVGEYEPTPSDEDKYNKLKEDGYISIGKYMVKPTTIMGGFNIHTVSTAYNLWYKYFPFDTNKTQNIFNEILAISSSEDKLNTSRDVEIKQNVFKHMKKYFAAMSTSGIINSNLDINSERERIFLDTKDNTSLAKYMNRLINISGNPVVDNLIKTNRLINRFEYQVAKVEGEPSKIIYNNAGGEEFDEQYLYESLTNLLTQRDANGNRIELPKIGNKEYTLDTLAQDLIKYSYLGNATQEAIQFTKYIPTSYLDAVGYSKHMKNVDRDLTFGVSKPVDAKDWSKVNRITMQYFQHNPDEVKYKLSTKNFLKDITENNSKKLDELTEFKLKNNNKPVFIGIRNPSEKNKYKTNSGFQLYWFNGEKYVRIPVLGAFGMDEYQPKNYIGESILGKNIEIEQPVEGILGNDKQEEDEEPEDRFSISTGSVPKVLDSIINSNIEYYSELAKQLKPFINDGLKIGYGDSVETKDGTKTAFYGTYVWDTNNIIIHETNSIKLDDKRMAEVILEEVLHGMTIHNLNNYITLGKNGNVEVELNAPKYVTDLVQLYNDVRNTTDPQRISDVLKRIKNNEGLATNDRDIYALSDIYEFVARSLTNQDFQKFLAQDKFKQSGQSRLEKFKDFIFNVLKALGINFDKDSATVQAINSIFEFIKDTSENEKNQSISDLDMWNSIDYDDISNNDLLNKVDKFMEDEIMTDKDVDDFNKLFDGNNVEASLSPINFPDKTFDFKEEKCL